MAVAVALDDDGWHAQAGLVLNGYKSGVAAEVYTDAGQYSYKPYSSDYPAQA